MAKETLIERCHRITAYMEASKKEATFYSRLGREHDARNYRRIATKYETEISHLERAILNDLLEVRANFSADNE